MEQKTSPNVVRETYKAGDFVFHEGEVGYHFYIIESGEVQILTQNKQSQWIVIGTVNTGDSFGEFALLDKKPRSASARAKSDVTVVRVSPQGYEELLKDVPEWAVSMLKAFMRRMKYTTELLQKVPQFLPEDR